MTDRGYKRFIKPAAFFWALALMIYLAAGSQFHRIAVATDALSPAASVGELSEGAELVQRIKAPSEQITGIDIMAGTYGRANTGTLTVAVQNAAGETLAQKTVDAALFLDGQYTSIALDQTEKTARPGEALTVRLTAQGGAPGSALTVFWGNTVMAGRFDLPQDVAQEDRFTLNGEAGVGMLCLKLNGIREITFYRTYWIIVAAMFALLAAYTAYGLKRARQGRNNLVAMIDTLFTKYRFLLKQLVLRDFKLKYKRSVLGMGWSFLNPLLTMMVQYIVFSTLFKSDTRNYPVYLLSGIVFFNFFSEAVGLGMTSITGNAALIKKVYMPKYIYPLSKMFLAFINFALALIPLFVVTLLTGTAIRPSVLLLAFDILCLSGFVLGMALLLSTMMTFFQDTQFLWGVLSMLWMYLTPIFYPETIIPQHLLTYYHMNPMYHYITFARICIIDGTSPEPMAYLWCVLSSAFVLAVGLYVFKKKQDRFILYL